MGLRRVALVLAALALIGAAALFVVRANAAKRWDAVLAHHATAVAALRNDPAPHEPLTVRGHPGNAWAEYEPAFASLAALSDAEAGRWDGLAGMAIRRIREGVRREQAVYAFDPASSKEPDYAGAIRAATLFGRMARERREAGDSEGALDVIADALQVALDVGRIPRHAALVAAVGPLSDPAIDELRAMVAAPQTPPASLLRVRLLARAMDRQLPSSSRAYAGEQAAFIEACRLFLASSQASGVGRWVVLGSGLSWRLPLAEHAEAWSKRVEAASWTESQAWPAMLQALAASGSDRELAAQTIVPFPVPSWLAAERRVRETRARLRLLQAAAVERVGRGPGGPEWPADPFTLDGIRRRDGPHSVLYWSVGSDGDQGGAGDWRPAASTPHDLVLEIPH